MSGFTLVTRSKAIEELKVAVASMCSSPPPSADKHFAGRPAYDISQQVAYGSGGEISALCQQLEISWNPPSLC